MGDVTVTQPELFPERQGMIFSDDLARAMGAPRLHVHPMAAMPEVTYKRTMTVCTRQVDELLGNPLAPRFAPAWVRDDKDRFKPPRWDVDVDD